MHAKHSRQQLKLAAPTIRYIHTRFSEGALRVLVRLDHSGGGAPLEQQLDAAGLPPRLCCAAWRAAAEHAKRVSAALCEIEQRGAAIIDRYLYMVTSV